MCGIIGVYVKRSKHIKRDILNIYQKQSHRGKSGFGILIKKPSGLIYRKRFTKESDMIKDNIWLKIAESDIILFHHRIPTSTPNIKQCNHPLSNEKRNMYLIHNGHIDEEDLLLSHNHVFESQIKTFYGRYKEYQITDTELAIHFIEEAMKRGATKEEAIKEMVEEVFYSSFIVVFKDEHKLFFASNNQALKYFRYKKNIFLASETNYLSADMKNRIGYVTAEDIDFKPIESHKKEYMAWGLAKNNTLYEGDKEGEDEEFFDFYEEENKSFMEDITDSLAFQQYKEEMLFCVKKCEGCPMLRNCVYDFQSKDEKNFYSEGF